MHLDVSGELKVVNTAWPEGPHTRRTDIVSYNLDSLAPSADVYLTALRGQIVEAGEFSKIGAPPAINRALWWRCLLDRVVARTGVQAWTGRDKILAYDLSRRHLHVVNEPHVRALVEQVLDEIDEQQSRVAPLHIEVMCGSERASRLRLDVPWWQEAGATRALGYAFVADFDIEVTQGSWVTDPLLLRLESGLGICATRTESQDGGTVHIAASWSRRVPTFTPYEAEVASLDSGTFRIELPDTDVWQWRGRLGDDHGSERSLRVDPETSIHLRVGHESAPSSAWTRSWRVVAPRGNPEGVSSPARRLRLALRGSRSGALGRSLLALSPDEPHSFVTLRPSAPLPAASRPVLRLLADDPVASGAIRITARTVGDPNRPYALDVELEIGARHEDPRETWLDIKHEGGAFTRVRTPLPVARIVQTHRRVWLTPHVSTDITFSADLGLGMETLELSIRE